MSPALPPNQIPMIYDGHQINFHLQSARTRRVAERYLRATSKPLEATGISTAVSVTYAGPLYES